MTKPAESVATTGFLKIPPAPGLRPAQSFCSCWAWGGPERRALTRILSLCGGTLPAGLKGADSHNPRGYWEPRATLRLNEAILRRHGSVVVRSVSARAGG